MNVNLCTISFRNHLVSFEELVSFASLKGFSGIELWGVHGIAFLGIPWKIEKINLLLKEHDLSIPMISGYIDILSHENLLEEEFVKVDDLINLAKKINVKNIRAFAGHLPSKQMDEKTWKLCVKRLKIFSEKFMNNGMTMIIETHPNTMADTLETTARMLDDVNHPGLGINLDFLHIWESGGDPVEAYHLLKPYLFYCHLKNISSRDYLSVFNSSNIFGPRGDKTGIVMLPDGIIDYTRILNTLLDDKSPVPVSLEWFGDNPFESLESQISWINKIITTYETDKDSTTILR